MIYEARRIPLFSLIFKLTDTWHKKKQHILLQGLQGSGSMCPEGDNSVSVGLEVKADGSEGTVQRGCQR